MSTPSEERQVEPTTPPTQGTTADLADDAAELAFFNNTDASRSELPSASDARPETKAERQAEGDDEKDGKDEEVEGGS